MNLRAIYEKYKDIIPYLFFGICTTIINILIFYVLAHMLLLSTMLSTCIAWFVAVIFAYLTNRTWVFQSNAFTMHEKIKEFLTFLTCRITTGLIDCFTMWLFVDILSFHDLFIKFAANILVIILNYISSKLIIFKKRKHLR